MKSRRRQTVTHFVVAKDYFSIHGDNMRDEFPILYGTEAEAKEMMARLNAGSDKSFFDDSDLDASAFLYIDTYDL